MRTGQFGVVRTHTTMGWIIRLFTRSQVSHAYLYVDEHHVIEATWNGAVINSSPKFEKEAPGELHPVSNLALSPAQRERVVAAARELAGTPYGFRDIAALALVHWGVPWRWAARVVGDDKGLICSQLVDRCYANAGIHLYDDGRADGSVTPGDLLLLMAEAWSNPPPVTESEEVPE